MGREKSEIHRQENKSLQKTFLGCQDKSRSSKKPTCKKEPEEIDSLIFLKDAKDKEKVKGLDDRIKLLKYELKTLLGDTKSEKTDPRCFTKCESDLMSPDVVTLDKHDDRIQLDLQSDTKSVEKFDFRTKPSKTILKTSPSKFSEWLDKTIDEITVESQNQKKFSQCNNSPSHSKSEVFPDVFTTSESSFKSKCLKSSPLSQHKLEQMLYQSLYLQNFDIYLSSSDDNGTDEVKSTKKIRHQKQKIRNRKSIKKSSKEKHCQSKINKYCRASQRPRKRKRITFPSESEVEIVDLLDCSSVCNNNTVESPHVEYVDLNVTDYDWNEPFDVNEKRELFSDEHVIEDSEEEITDINSEKHKLSNSEPVANSLSTFIDKPKNAQLSRGWECPICLELSKGQEVVATQCGHIFCKKCLESHISKFNSNCPTCRTDLNNKPFITLFNF